MLVCLAFGTCKEQRRRSWLSCVEGCILYEMCALPGCSDSWKSLEGFRHARLKVMSSDI